MDENKVIIVEGKTDKEPDDVQGSSQHSVGILDQAANGRSFSGQ